MTENFQNYGISYFVIAALYLKNTIVKYWKEGEASEQTAEGTDQPFTLDEQSKAVIRENVIGAIIQCPLILG